MSGIVFSETHQRVIDAGRALLTQKILREAETVEVLHEMHLNGDAENIRLAEEAHKHAALMTSAAMLGLYQDMKVVARDEIEAEMSGSENDMTARWHAKGWTYVSCGCCAGLEWGGAEPRECKECGGNGSLWKSPKGRLAIYPGGPFVGVA